MDKYIVLKTFVKSHLTVVRKVGVDVSDNNKVESSFTVIKRPASMRETLKSREAL